MYNEWLYITTQGAQNLFDHIGATHPLSFLFFLRKQLPAELHLHLLANDQHTYFRNYCSEYLYIYIHIYMYIQTDIHIYIHRSLSRKKCLVIL